jgi:hypothetical protein
LESFAAALNPYYTHHISTERKQLSDISSVRKKRRVHEPAQQLLHVLSFAQFLLVSKLPVIELTSLAFK